MTNSANGSKRHTTISQRSASESSEPSGPSISEPPEPRRGDPLEKLEELLDSENFDTERISVVMAEPARNESARPSLVKNLRKKHPRLALAVTVIVASAVWVKVIAEFFETLR